jgi:hypothetical protein
MLEQHLYDVLAFGVYPLWLAAGAADWLCHRATRIERTSGSRESVYHLLLFGQMAIAVLAVLFLEVDTLVLLLLALCVAAHFATSLLDTRYAQPRRRIWPIEQMVHSFLDVLPLAGLAIVALLHPDALSHPHVSLALRGAAPSPAAVTLVLLGLCAALALIVEEWWRGQRVTS